MKAIVNDNVTSDISIPIAYLRGSRALFAQEFISITNLLAFNPEYVTSGVGTIITTPVDNQDIKLPGIELTGDFYKDPVTSELLPIWYSQTISRAVDASAILNRSKTVVVNTNNSTDAKISGLIERENQYIVRNQIEFQIDGQIQRKESYYIDFANGSLNVDISDLGSGEHTLTVKYQLVELSIETQVNDGINNILIVYSYNDSQYIAKIGFTVIPTGTITYQSKGDTYVEVSNVTNLYQRVPSELVESGSFTFSYDGQVKFPSSHKWQLFAIQASTLDSITILYVDSPKGVNLDSPWYVKVRGIPLVDQPISEYSGSLLTSEDRKDKVKILNNTQLAITGRNVVRNGNDDGTLSGIDVFLEGEEDNLIPVIGFNQASGIIELGVKVPLEASIFAKYTEDIDWVEYTNLQLNPSIQEDATDVLENFIVLYLISDITKDENIYHILLPKIVNGLYKEYSFDEVNTVVKDIDIAAIPMAIMQIIEPVDKDYYEIFDMRTRGGYSEDILSITDNVHWDGEDVDISGITVVRVPEIIVAKRSEELRVWEGIEDKSERRVLAKQQIEAIIDKYKRIGMKVYVEYED